jgi:hypothetical protein
MWRTRSSESRDGMLLVVMVGVPYWNVILGWCSFFWRNLFFGKSDSVKMCPNPSRLASRSSSYSVWYHRIKFIARTPASRGTKRYGSVWRNKRSTKGFRIWAKKKETDWSHLCKKLLGILPTSRFVLSLPPYCMVPLLVESSVSCVLLRMHGTCCLMKCVFALFLSIWVSIILQWLLHDMYKIVGVPITV